MCAAPIHAAGSVAVLKSDVQEGVTRYILTWTSDASGNVSGNRIDIRRGTISQVQFSPSTGGTMPDRAHDVELDTLADVDALMRTGRNLDDVVSHTVVFSPGYYHDESGRFGSLGLRVRDAGASNVGTVTIWVRQ